MNATKFIIKSTVFAVIISLLLIVASNVLMPYHYVITPRAQEFFNYESSDIDVLFIGSSSLTTAMSPLVIWNETGITSYNFGDMLQGPSVMYRSAIEAYKKFQPKIVVLGIITLCSNYNFDKRETSMRNAYNNWPVSANKLGGIREIVENSQYQTAISYIFPALRYHDRWSDLTARDFMPNKNSKADYKRGQWTVFETVSVGEDINRIDTQGKAAKISDSAAEYFVKTVEYCRERGSDVIFYMQPSDQWGTSRHLAAKEFADGLGVTLLDYSMDEYIAEIGLDFDTDYYDASHMNPYGAAKTSKYLAEYLQENYSLEDKRGNEEIAALWNDDAEKLYAKMREKMYEIFSQEDIDTIAKVF